MEQSFETLLFELQGPVAVIRLNRPHRMNAVIEQMYLDLDQVLTRVSADPEIRAVILTGSVRRSEKGDKQAFCAGADLKEHATGERTAKDKRDYILLAHETTKQLYGLPKPVIAAINGPARGAGAEMALACDFVLMADTASLAFPETGLGTFVGGGSTRHLARAVGEVQAKRLIYFGTVLSGRSAADLGLALESVPLDELLPRAMDLAQELAAKAPLSMAFAKDLVQRAARRDRDTALLAETEAILACMGTEDWAEGIASFAEGRKPRYSGK